MSLEMFPQSALNGRLVKLDDQTATIEVPGPGGVNVVVPRGSLDSPPPLRPTVSGARLGAAGLFRRHVEDESRNTEGGRHE